MDQPTALELLPPAYAAALRLQEGGASYAAIARMLGIEVEAVQQLLEIGALKLDKILSRDPRD
jgi:DNA-directed RNA polymerase specialized sigma24 family protein